MFVFFLEKLKLEMLPWQLNEKMTGNKKTRAKNKTIIKAKNYTIQKHIKKN